MFSLKNKSSRYQLVVLMHNNKYKVYRIKANKEEIVTAEDIFYGYVKQHIYIKYPKQNC